MSVGAAWIDIRKSIRDYVNHPAARAWANKVIDSFDTDTVTENDAAIAIERMEYFLKDKSGNILSSSFKINSKTGRAIGEMQYRTPDNSND